MRRALTVGFLVGTIAAGIALCARYGEGPPAPAKPPVTFPTSSAPTSAPAPRPANPPRTSFDAGREVARARSDEQTLLLHIRALVKTDPERAETLARESRQRFPNGPTADERDALLVDALIGQQRIGRARDETYYYFDHHPEGRFADHLFIMTGVHPRPKGPSSAPKPF